MRFVRVGNTPSSQHLVEEPGFESQGTWNRSWHPFCCTLLPFHGSLSLSCHPHNLISPSFTCNVHAPFTYAPVSLFPQCHLPEVPPVYTVNYRSLPVYSPALAVHCQVLAGARGGRGAWHPCCACCEDNVRWVPGTPSGFTVSDTFGVQSKPSSENK